jgi:threonine dehydratase
MNFLNAMSPHWNISLFHYRNHGGDYGKILVGMQVPKKNTKELNDFLKGTGYRYWDESQHPAYQLFLK